MDEASCESEDEEIDAQMLRCLEHIESTNLHKIDGINGNDSHATFVSPNFGLFVPA